MTLRARLALAFFTIALLLAIPLAASLRALQDAQTAVEQLRRQEFAASLLLTKIRATTAQLRQAEQSVYVNRGDSASAEYLHRSTRDLRAFADSLRAFHLDSLQRQLRSSSDALARFGDIEIAAFLDGEVKLADNVSSQQVLPAIGAVERELTTTDAHLRTEAATKVGGASMAARSAERLALLLLLVAVASAIVVAAWITRSISRPVRDLEHGMQEVAGGNFSHRLSIAPGRGDEFGRLAASFTSMAEQLAELDKLKAEFVSVASHELKTPINVIMGYLKLLEENLYGELNPRQAEVIGVMQGQADSMGRLVQHLLDVSRFEAGAARLEARPMDLRGFLQQLKATYEVLAMERGVTFSVVSSDTLPEVVTWDADRINEVLGNLLSNAFKFTESGGRVDLVVTALEESVYIEVRDTGVGISPEQLPHIFDKFFQADNQKTAGAKGTGLGLAIAKEIVEAHGGSIAAESALGQGTKFSIMLPVSATHTADGESSSAPEGSAGAAAEQSEPTPAEATA